MGYQKYLRNAGPSGLSWRQGRYVLYQGHGQSDNRDIIKIPVVVALTFASFELGPFT